MALLYQTSVWAIGLVLFYFCRFCVPDLHLSHVLTRLVTFGSTVSAIMASVFFESLGACLHSILTIKVSLQMFASWFVLHFFRTGSQKQCSLSSMCDFKKSVAGHEKSLAPSHTTPVVNVVLLCSNFNTLEILHGQTVGRWLFNCHKMISFFFVHSL